MKYVSEKLDQQLLTLAETLVTPERYMPVAELAVASAIPVENLRFDD